MLQMLATTLRDKISSLEEIPQEIQEISSEI